MRAIDIDYDDPNFIHDDDSVHAHYVSTTKPDDHVDLGHGQRSDRVYDERGAWYALHRH